MVISHQMGFAQKYLERARKNKSDVETGEKSTPKFNVMVKISNAPKTEACEKYPVDHKKLHEKLGWSIPQERVDKILKRSNEEVILCEKNEAI